jgi:predicted esterase YcpF (UPF0227 family)
MPINLHGFNSSPGSHKAQVLKRYMAKRGLDEQYCCPALPHLPTRAIAAVEAEIAKHPHESITLIGSSLGGFYSTYLAERHDLRAVLINPAVYPHDGLRAYLGVQRNLHSHQQYELTEEHLRQWEKLYLPASVHSKYLLLLETGMRCRLSRSGGNTKARADVIAGGDHSLVTFPAHSADPEFAAWLESESGFGRRQSPRPNTRRSPRAAADNPWADRHSKCGHRTQRREGPNADLRTSISLRMSIPVFTPMDSNMNTRSSVTTLPEAPGAKGQPPKPPRVLSKLRTPTS